MFRIFLNINSISYSFRSIANQNGVKYSDSTSYFKKYSSSKCKQTVCLHYGLDFHFKRLPGEAKFRLSEDEWNTIKQTASKLNKLQSSYTNVMARDMAESNAYCTGCVFEFFVKKHFEQKM